MTLTNPPTQPAAEPVGDDENVSWARSWTAGIGERLRAARRSAGLTMQQVADRTAELGYPISRASIATLETRPRDRIHVQDVAVLAAAVGVAPVEILYPLDITTAPGATPTLAGAVDSGVLKSTSVQMLPRRLERAVAAAAWFTGGFGRLPEARLAVITSYGAFKARNDLKAILLEQEQSGALAARLKSVANGVGVGDGGAGAVGPGDIRRVLEMEVYDLACWALEAIDTFDQVAARNGSSQQAVSGTQRATAERAAATHPPGYLPDPHERPYVHGVLGIGVPTPGAAPTYLQPWTDDPQALPRPFGLGTT